MCVPLAVTWFRNGPRPSRIMRVIVRVKMNVTTNARKHSIRGSLPAAITSRCHHEAMLPPSARLLPETENGQQSFVDAPLLLRTDAADQRSQPADVDSADLLDKDAGSLTQEVDLRAEGRSPSAVRGRSYEYDRPRQQLVRLHDDPVPAPLLLLPSSAWRAEFVNVTPEHACSP